MRLLQASEIADTSAVTINSDGLFDLNNSGEIIGSLNVNGGNVTIGSGSLTLSAAGTVTMTGGSISATTGQLKSGREYHGDFLSDRRSVDKLQGLA